MQNEGDIVSDGGSAKESQGLYINFKRVLDRMVRFWHLIALSLLIGLTTAFLINRYTTRIYPVQASIIIKESEENAGAKFLYDNELISPYRNFLNEIYIMKSYPLMQEVVEALGFQVSFFREGDIVTTEFYDSNFPIRFHVIKSEKMPYGLSMNLEISENNTFSLQYMTDDEKHPGKKFSDLPFNDTIRVNGFRLYAELRRKDLSPVFGKRFIIKFNNSLSLAMAYSKRVSATWAAVGASVVNLDISGPLPHKEIDFLAKFIERYQAYDVEKKNKVATMAMKFLEDQLITTGDSLRHFEDKVEDFKNRNVITGLKEETNRLYLKIQGFEEQKFQYRLNENYYQYISNLLRNENYTGIFTPKSVGIEDNVIAGLITEIVELQSQVAVYRGNRAVSRPEENPLMKSAIQRMNFLKTELLNAIDNNRKTEKINSDFISEQITLAEKQLARLPRSERELISIQRNYGLKENLYVFLLQKRTEAGLSKASTTSDIVIVNPPIAGPYTSPKTLQIYGIGAAAGLMLPVLIFLLIEVFNGRIQSTEDISKITTVPVIGAVGHNRTSDPIIVISKPKSAMAESFRALRSNLNYFTGPKEHQVFLVTSSIPGEGKSFTTLNLAAIVASSGKRTLILGGDLRRPKLTEDLQLNNHTGLSQYLSGMAGLNEIIQASKYDNLFLISGGPVPPNPSELLLRPAMDVLMAELKKQFDCVVIDTPPLAFVADGFVMSKYADHTLFVVRQNFTPISILRSIDDSYSSGRLNKVSILFNDLRKSGMGYGHGYAYGYGYGYGSYGYNYGAKNKRSGGYYEES